MELKNLEKLPIAIIGAGPVGLAAAAHLIKRNLKPVIFEKGTAPADAVRSWSHVRVFSPWIYNIDVAARSLLEENGWRAPNPEGLPTGAELLDEYLEPLARHPKVAANIHYNAKVTAITRKSSDAPFRVQWMNGEQQKTTEAAAVIDASGTWFSPNRMGIDGSTIQGEHEFSKFIHYGIPDVLGKDRNRYEGKKVLVVGAGHSAINAVLDLLKLQKSVPTTKVIWSLRKNRLEKLFGGGLNDKLPARGSLGNAAKDAIDQKLLLLLVPFSPTKIEQSRNGLKISGNYNNDRLAFEVDRIIVATGSRPDLEMFRELRTSLDPILEAPPALAPLIDPNLHSCGTVPPHGFQELSHPEPGFFIVGSKSYGRAPTFLMATGYEQVRSVVAEIAGDRKAALDVRLVLPETGVCSASLNQPESSNGCCGGPSPSADSCCVKDHEAKLSGEAGCGCSKEKTPVLPETGVCSAPLNQPESSNGCCGGPSPSADSCCVKDHEAKLSGEAGCGCSKEKTPVISSNEVQSSCCARP